MLAFGILMMSGLVAATPSAQAGSTAQPIGASAGSAGWRDVLPSGNGGGSPVVVEVKLDKTLVVPDPRAGRYSEFGHALTRLDAALDPHGGIEDLRAFVPATAADRLADIASEAESRGGAALPNLASWYTLVIRANGDADDAGDIVADLRALPEVEFAEAVPEPLPPPAQSATANFSDLQGYFLSPAKNGIAAEFSRGDSRLRGDGITIVDLEYDWNPSHEDLMLDWSTDLGGERFVRLETFGDDHGTAVFGLLVARDNGYGVTGGVPGAEIYGLSPVEQLSAGMAWRPGPALAYLASLPGADGEPFLQPGDVVLIEQQGPQVIPDADCPVEPGTCYSPLEWNVAVHEAIRVLTSMGVSVVASGGNGYHSTDHPAYTRDGQAWFGLGNRSGSILVGAGDSRTRERLPFSNHGSAFDLQGWGGQVVTTGYCSLFCSTDDHDIRYSQTFGGTSGAASIVAVAVAAVQSYLKATDQEPWSAEEIADLLEATGQPQGLETTGERIGPLPNLKAAVRTIEDQPPGLAEAEIHRQRQGLGR